MTDDHSDEFHAFTSLMDKLVRVPKSAIHKRMAEHRAKSAENPMRPGPKPKEKTAEPVKARKERR